MRYRNLNATGRAGRARRLAVASIFLGAVPIIVLINHDALNMPDALIWYSLTALPVCAWLWVRLPFTGVYVNADVVLVSSWWSRRRYHRRTIERFRAEPYAGFFFILGWTVYDGRFESGHLRAEFVDGKVRSMGATVCNRRVARQNAESLNQWLGLDVGSGDGPRRSVRRNNAVE